MQFGVVVEVDRESKKFAIFENCGGVEALARK